MCNLKYSVPKEITIFFHNGSNYDYHFVIKKLGQEFEGQFNSSGENAQKNNLLSFNRKRSYQKNWQEITKTISYIIQFIDSAKFTTSSLANLIDNLALGI